MANSTSNIFSNINYPTIEKMAIKSTFKHFSHTTFCILPVMAKSRLNNKKNM
ncbi:hypothetical protein C942_00698 [Photobacterium marinum]|uniref:Uncharacterized protein n=1 Tax=Photobacterium marinum TaxID=1056511 RepID=L8J9Q9_9GAMM|nr:hypothetical protein C942_00698 [Photobacterium marinum]